MNKQFSIEDIMEVACDLCQWPFTCTEDELEEKCEKCLLVDLLRREYSAE